MIWDTLFWSNQTITNENIWKFPQNSAFMNQKFLIYPKIKLLKKGQIKGQKRSAMIIKNCGWNHGILLPKLIWPTVRKICSSGREKLLKFKAEGRAFAKYLRSLEQFIQTVQWKVRTIFGKRMLFLLVPGGFSYLPN